MKTSILSARQKLFLKLFGKEKLLTKQFYLTGGTALSEYYISYRYSEDLDFFTEDEVSLEAINVFIHSIKKELNYISQTYNSSYNRNVFFLQFPEVILKLEFTYFPFPQIEQPKMKDGVKIDSIVDIATNKLFTIYQKPRSRDFIDLFMIWKKYHLGIEDLIKKARIKFDSHIDPIQLGTQFLLSKELKDYPRFISPINEKEWQNFFEVEARKLKKIIIEK